MPTRLTSTPLMQPAGKPAASASDRPPSTDRAGGDEGSAATMPARLAIEPTERSKSPITMTTVIVAATPPAC